MATIHLNARLATAGTALAGLVAVAGGVVLGAPTVSYASPGQSTSATYLVNCAHRPVQQPRIFTLTCGDANSGLMRTRWGTWGPNAATGTARYVENTCEPNCAAGTFRHYPATVTADRPRVRDGVRAYTRIVVRFAHRHPAWVKHGRAVFDVSFD